MMKIEGSSRCDYQRMLSEDTWVVIDLIFDLLACSLLHKIGVEEMIDLLFGVSPMGVLINK